jgi:OOP family OmpA-OmpF porin
MKKALFSSLLAATLLGAAEYQYELTPVGGFVYTEGTLGIENHPLYGAEMQFNNLDTFLKPELSLLYSNADFENNMGDADIYRAALNGVYEFAAENQITPFTKVGVGYEYLNDRTYDNRNSVFADAGAGVKIGLMDQLALKLEALYMLKYNDARWDNNLAFLAGLNFAFGEKEQPPAPVPEAKPEPAPEAKPVAAAPLDSDGDGVIDALDKCPGTPKGFKVDAEGCPLTYRFKVLFDFDSSKIKEEFTGTIEDFAAFMKENPYVADIQGHTCSIGTDEYNQKLSERRADAVMKKLIELGITPSRLKATGYGEAKPLNTNSTKEERQENRRVEAELSH